MRLLYSIACWNPKHGGPFFSVGNLASVVAAGGHPVSLLAADYPHMRSQAAPEGVELHTLSGRLIPGIRQTTLPGAAGKIDALLEGVRPDVIHDNGLWLTLNHQVAKAAKRHALPRVLSPRGTLDPWAFQYRNWKKRIAMTLYQRRDLETVDCFHAASPLEAENIRRFGLKQPIAVIPNGVDVPDQPAHFGIEEGGEKQGAGYEKTSPKLQAPRSLPKKRTALFIGRMHPVKNLPALLDAWARVRPEGWRLKLVGSSEVGHREELEEQAKHLGIGESVEFSEPVYGEAKAKLLRDAQLCCLVSHSENFGIAAAEGLAAGLPLLASKAIPWQIVEEEQAGWWVEGSVDGLAEALADATRRSPDELKTMGLQGRGLAERKFGWPTIVDQISSVYEWLSGGGEKAACVDEE